MSIFKLKDLCTLFGDGDWIESKDQSTEGIRLIQTGNIKNGKFENRIDKARYISEKTFRRLNCKDIREGDILVSRLPEPVGRACIIPKLKDKAITAVDCSIIRLSSEILPEYLIFFMQSDVYFNQIKKNITGSTRQRISRKSLGEIEIYVPPLPEQKRIVAKLDKAFTEIGKIISNTENTIHSSEFILTNLINKKTKSNDWREHKILDLGIVQTGNTPKTSQKENYGNDVPFVKPPHFKKNGLIEFDSSGLSLLGAKGSRKAKQNSVLMVCIGATIGKVAINNKEVCFNQQINSLTPIEKYDSEFIYWQMRSKNFQKDLIKKSGQATLPIINKSKWQNLSIFIPNNLEEQVKTRKLLRNINTKLDIFLKNKESKLALLIRLKSAILKKELQSEAA